MVIAMLVVLASLGPSLSQSQTMGQGRGQSKASSGTSLRYSTKTIGQLALSSKEGGAYCEPGSACPLTKQQTR